MPTEQSTNDRLSAIRDRDKAATPGPWRWAGNVDAHHMELTTVDRGMLYVMRFARWGYEGRPADVDAEFIAHARADVPYLLERIADLEDALWTLYDESTREKREPPDELEATLMRLPEFSEALGRARSALHRTGRLERAREAVSA